MKYKCLETFDVPAVDEEGIEMDERFEVIESSIWKNDKHKPIAKNDEEVFLVSDGGRLNIAKDLFDLMFEVVEG
ncbi:hypothetical protein [Enterococcus mundtii]|uniref:Uncharacterized protein n=1 Tax=Enterococcus mundtii TaxID=53346 RepID=A0A848MU50_ENTMU|nr:hypothetical protein [Enterococcus mundtii]NMP59076.1 hypothetical protein [Enterococcus mundtii]